LDFATVAFPGDKAYALPIGDIHWGDAAFAKNGKAKLKGNLDWLEEHKDHAFGVLMGDVFNVASIYSKTSPFENNSREFIEARQFFEPYKHLFVGAIRGNHEARLLKSHGFDPLEVFCDALGIPYLGVSALLRVQVGKRPDSNWYWNSYYMAVHHTRGGGGSNVGNALRPTQELERIVPGCDIYAGGHNHQLVTGTQMRMRPTPNGVTPYKVHFVSCGSYLEYENSYAEEGMYLPSKLGSPRIRFSGVRDHHDVHVSL
jgi:hypothetical protein